VLRLVLHVVEQARIWTVIRKTLVAAHPGNRNGLRHGVYSESGRALAPRAAQLMQVPHTMPMDRVAAEEVASIVARLDAIDRDLEARALGRGGARSLLDV
jgi:hypothetical protein